jgi:5-methylcytosine-specific restriction endonuclease McrA
MLGKDFNPCPKPTHKRSKPERFSRGKFTKHTREKIKEKYDGLCQMCFKKGFHVHHTMPKGRGGRNVETNALLLCNTCHRKVHDNEEILQHWIDKFKEEYGDDFYKDEHDLKHDFENKRLDEIYHSQKKEWGV